MTDPQSGVTAYVYDTLNRLASLTDPAANNFTFSYDALGRRTALSHPNGNVTNYQYDQLSRLLSVVHQNGKSAVDGAQYTYDAAGNRTSKVNLLKKDTTTNYTYDALYQLTQATGGTSEQYQYDAVGNRTFSSSLNSSYSYGASNDLDVVNTGGALSIYSYDANGNPVSKTGASGTTTYAWDFENRLVQVVVPASGRTPANTVTFRYDPFGRRVQKSSSAGTTNYVYDGANILEEVDATGAVGNRYTQGAGIDEPLAVQQGRSTLFYQADGLGSITSLASASGGAADYYVYDSFGNVTASHGSFAQPFGFTGRELDQETGLMYYRARYYDPAVGRFISEDQVRFEAGSTNFYPYVYSRPLSLVDPSGNCPKKTCLEVFMDGASNALKLGQASKVNSYWKAGGNALMATAPILAQRFSNLISWMGEQTPSQIGRWDAARDAASVLGAGYALSVAGQYAVEAFPYILVGGLDAVAVAGLKAEVDAIRNGTCIPEKDALRIIVTGK